MLIWGRGRLWRISENLCVVEKNIQKCLLLNIKHLIFASENLTIMKSITINIFEIGSSRTMQETIMLTGLTSKEIGDRKKNLLESCPFKERYYEVESENIFTDDELDMLEEFDLVPDELLK